MFSWWSHQWVSAALDSNIVWGPMGRTQCSKIYLILSEGKGLNMPEYLGIYSKFYESWLVGLPGLLVLTEINWIQNMKSKEFWCDLSNPPNHRFNRKLIQAALNFGRMTDCILRVPVHAINYTICTLNVGLDNISWTKRPLVTIASTFFLWGGTLIIVISV